MDAAPALVVSVLLAVLIAARWGKPAATWVSGLLTRDKKGRVVLVLTPAKPKRRKRRR